MVRKYSADHKLDVQFVLAKGSGTIDLGAETMNLRIDGETKEPRLIRANLPGGATIYYYAYVSITATPTLSRNNIMTRTITLSFASRPTRYNA